MDYALPLFGHYPWLPGPMRRAYLENFERFDRNRLTRRFGVSTLVIGRRPT